jgi:hypothetical protein
MLYILLYTIYTKQLFKCLAILSAKTVPILIVVPTCQKVNDILNTKILPKIWLFQ